jgi:hypothetical protein
MRRRTIIALVALVVVIAGVTMAIVDQSHLSAEGDHPTPAVRDPKDPSAPAPTR